MEKHEEQMNTSFQRNKFYQKHHLSFAYNRAFYRNRRREVMMKHRGVTATSRVGLTCTR